ncbi:hypothetical protein PG988_013833 [Apiospora saccharicola]
MAPKAKTEAKPQAKLKRELKALGIPQDADGYPTDEFMAFFNIRRSRSGNVLSLPGPIASGSAAGRRPAIIFESPPPDDYRTLVNNPSDVWYANRRKHA